MQPGPIAWLLLAAPAAWPQSVDGLPVAQHEAPSESRSESPSVERTPAEVLAACVAASPEGEGLEELELACPGIERALVELGYSPFIAEQQLDTLGWYTLHDLKLLDDRYTARPAAAEQGVRTESLAAILQSLQETQQERELNWLEKFSRWIRGLSQDSQQAMPAWLQRWLEDTPLSQTIVRWMIYGALTLLVVMALGVVINELRAAGLLRRKGAKARAAAAAGAATAGELTIADLENAAPADRPSLLLRLLVAALVKRGRLRADRSLTHRELVARAAFDAAAQRESFGRLAALSERTIYGGMRAEGQEIDGVVAAGRALMATLDAPAAGAAPHVAPAAGAPR